MSIPDELVHAKAHEMWHQTERRLAAQGLDPARYLQVTGKTEEELVQDAEPEARKALERESVLASVVEAENIEVTDDEILDSLRDASRTDNEKKLRRSFEKAKAEGRDEPLREDIAMRKAVDLMVESAKPISVEQAKARKKLWTPGKEAGSSAAEQEIWTPGSS
jgi:trigger factor